MECLDWTVVLEYMYLGIGVCVPAYWSICTGVLEYMYWGIGVYVLEYWNVFKIKPL